ncbi:hypothetical protein B0158_22270 [Salmonella enterica subsp. enterica serovar Enteritidis]|nr:hypothetical protein [Salmonella enterica subsp. enterica serovar Enteritidis]
MNNKLPEWRKTLNKCVENYQSTRAWYEENRDSPAALDDMERAEDQLANFVKKCGFSIVLGLLDEIDELQELHRSCLALRGEIEDVQAQLYEAENRNNADAEELQERRKADSDPVGEFYEDGPLNWYQISDGDRVPANKRVPLYRHAQPAPVVPDGLRQALSNAGIAAPESDEMLAATCEKYIQMLVTWVKDRKPFQPVPVVPEKMSKHALFEVAIARFSKMNEGFPIKRFKADWVISWMLENFPPAAQKQGDN